MPHITIEYSANIEQDIDVRALVHAVHEAAIASGVFEIAAVRTRASRRDIYEIADGDPDNAFIHVDLNVAPGREVAIRQQLAKSVLEVIGRLAKKRADRSGLALSVEIREIDNATAQRRNNLHGRLAARRDASKAPS